MKYCVSLCLVLVTSFLMGTMLVGCRKTPSPVDGYEQITAEAAKELIDTQESFVILDVRTQQEYDLGHIPGAIVIPREAAAKAVEIAEGIDRKEREILALINQGLSLKEARVQTGYHHLQTAEAE